MPAINIRNVSFGYDAELIFEDLNLSLHTDWKLGFVGRNGRGKTTLMRLIAGELSPLRGTIESPVACGYFPYPLKGDVCSLQALQQGAPPFEQWELEREIRRLGMDVSLLERPVSTLSGGERTKLMLAALFTGPERFLLIDEPTNHLDSEGRRLVAQYLSKKRGFLLVSHDRAFLDQSVDHILSLNKSGMLIERGNYSSFAENQALRDRYEQERNEKLEDEITQLEKSQKDKRAWSDNIEKSKTGTGAYDRGYVGHQSARMMQRALSIQKRQQRLIDEKKELLQDIEYASALKVTPLPHDKRVFIRAEGLTLGYGEAPVIESLHFTLEQGERLAVTGPNGCGKSTLLRALLSDLPMMAGQLYIAPRLTVSHISQETGHLRGSLHAFAREARVDVSKFLMLLRKLDFPRREFDRDIRAMSEGQKKKVLIAASLCTPAHLYLWDEPLNFVDVMSRTQIEELIIQSSPTMILIEHDEFFLDRIGCRRLPLG